MIDTHISWRKYDRYKISETSIILIHQIITILAKRMRVMIVIFYSKNNQLITKQWKIKHKKARTLLLVFCYAFGSHTFALALEHEQTVETYKVTDVPNPRNESSSNWVSNPNQILDESYVWEINNMLSQLEDSLSIEVAIVALSSIGEDIPASFLSTGASERKRTTTDYWFF